MFKVIPRPRFLKYEGADLCKRSMGMEALPVSIADRICFDLGMTNRQLFGLVSSTRYRYHCFSAGGRKIVVPRPDLKLVQCWISDYINTEFDIDLPYATAYEKGSSVCRNAGLHAKSSHFLLLDLLFQSCTQQMVRNLFSGGTYRSTNTEILARVSTVRCRSSWQLS